ncbi:hypothetical protein JA1_000300 [Spathaspora sp. JA1]|nr:hypothetical protein JA1_000300 [Spathaspora sp. JA1]
MNQLSIYRSSSMTLNTSSVDADKEALNEEFHSNPNHSQQQPQQQHQQQSRRHRHSSHLPHSPLQQYQLPDDLDYSQGNYTSSSSNDFLTQIPTRSTYEGSQPMSRYYSHSNSSHRSSPRYTDEYIKQHEEEFLEQSKQGWIHGFSVPYSIITFDTLQENTTKKKLVKSYDQNMFTPKLVLDEIEHSAFQRKDSIDDTNADTGNALPTDEQWEELAKSSNIYYNQDYAGAFAGYLSIPRLTYNLPNGYRNTNHHQQRNLDVPKLIYSNYLNHENLTYIFGGLYACKSTNFKRLGLPTDVDISRVSVKFPYELPPFVNTKILTNPFMQFYSNFFMYNAQRASVTCFDIAQMEEFPHNISSMTGTQISNRHFFFYGGFSIIDKSVIYNPEINRWIIHKDFALNEDGYIIDTVTLKFTKIKLSTKETSFITLGRMGNGICANVYDRDEYMGGNFPRAPSPPIFTATTTSAPATATVPGSGPGTRTGTATSSLTSAIHNGPSKSPTRDLNINFPTGSHTSINIKLNNLKNEDTGSYAGGSSKQSSLHRIITTNSFESQQSSSDSGKLPAPHIPPPVLPSQQFQHLQSHKQHPPNVAKLRINPNLPPANTNGTPSTASAASAASTVSATNPHLLQTPSSSTTKMMGNVLAKSTRIFHRHRHTLSDGNSSSSGVIGSAGHDTGSLSSSRSRIRSPHPLKYSYSQRHKEHRSKSPLAGSIGNTNSRPSSRAVSPNFVASKPIPPGQLGTPTTTSSTINTMNSIATTASVGVNSVSNLVNASVGSTPTPRTGTPSIKSENSSPTPIPISQIQYSPSSTPQVQFPFPNYALDGDPVRSTATRRINTSRPDDLEEIASIVSDDDNTTGGRSAGGTGPGLRKRKENSLFNQPSSIISVVVFVYGGFIKDDVNEDGVQQFRATSDLLKIELSTRNNDDKRGLGGFVFLPEALVSNVGTPDAGHFDIFVEEGEWPKPRGYFASVLIDYQDGNLEENCALDVSIERPNSPTCILQPGMVGPNSSSSIQLTNDLPSAGGGGIETGENTGTTAFTCGSTINESEISQAEQYLSNKALLVQGGCDESNNFFSDFWLFVFQTGKWERLNTFVYDSFNIPLEGDEDDDLDKYKPEYEVEQPELKEAELRSCHHTVMYYKNEERDYLFFIGGLRQDYLRNFDSSPYKSDKFDVSRFSRFPIVTDNSIFVRISVLNIQTQTWRFMKYYYDIKHTITRRFVEKTSKIPGLMHARLCNLGGVVCMSEKMIIIGDGFAVLTPEKKNILEEMKKAFPFDELLFGGNILITFPGL